MFQWTPCKKLTLKVRFLQFCYLVRLLKSFEFNACNLNSSISVHCSSTEFKCANSRKCIPSFKRWNGNNDCGDNSDEKPNAKCYIISGPGAIGRKCVFPFKHKGVTYRGCPVQDGERWCPTKVENQIFDPSSVGVCSESCPKYDHKGKKWFQS